MKADWGWMCWIQGWVYFKTWLEQLFCFDSLQGLHSDLILLILFDGEGNRNLAAKCLRKLSWKSIGKLDWYLVKGMMFPALCFHGWNKFLAMQMKLENLTLFKNLLTLQFCKPCLSVLLFRCQLCLVLTWWGAL